MANVQFYNLAAKSEITQIPEGAIGFLPGGGIYYRPIDAGIYEAASHVSADSNGNIKINDTDVTALRVIKTCPETEREAFAKVEGDKVRVSTSSGEGISLRIHEESRMIQVSKLLQQEGASVPVGSKITLSGIVLDPSSITIVETSNTTPESKGIRITPSIKEFKRNIPADNNPVTTEFWIYCMANKMGGNVAVNIDAFIQLAIRVPILSN